MTRSNIKTKDGRISAYGFACGYIEAVENGDKFDASRYISTRATGPYWDDIDGKDYYLKMRGNKPYLWAVYVDKVAVALEKIRG